MSIHIGAKNGDFAKVVLMPGDPLRAKLIAEHFLVDAKEITHVRGILGYTGFSKNGKRISVMASGMGQPSIGIYCRELYSQYGVESIIRVGTCGSMQEDVHMKDIVIAMGACSDFDFMRDFHLNGAIYSAIADFDLLEASVNEARKNKKKIHVGNILSEGIFYHDDPNMVKNWQKLGILAAEMESYALYSTAKLFKKRALCLLTVTDEIITHKALSSDERQNGLNEMIEIAIKTAEHFA